MVKMRLVFEWDRRKASSNLRKHKVSFDEARSAFQDENLLTFLDAVHSGDEPRFISIGATHGGRILLVIHTEIDSENDEIVIRIISARKATRSERKTYEER